MKHALTFIRAAIVTATASLALFFVGADSISGTHGAITQVDPTTLSCVGNVTFDDVPGGPAPGTNYDTIFASGGADFAERFAGQTLSFSGDHDVLSGSPTGPLTLQVGDPNQNLNIFSNGGSGSQVLTGLGPKGYPNFDAIGEGAFAVLFDFDQSEFGFDLVGGNGGSATVNFFKRDGSLIDTITPTGLANISYGFQRAGGLKDVAGISVHNDDLAGIGFDNLCHDVPAPTEGPAGDTTCSDGIDNDKDGLIDGDDPDCRPAITVVDIDIKPGSDPNSIKLSNKGVIPVAILTTPTFDATTVDPSSVCFGDAEAPAERDCTEAHSTGHIEDADGDGDLDLVLHYETAETGIDFGDTEACLSGTTFGGTAIEGCDSVRTLDP